MRRFVWGLLFLVVIPTGISAILPTANAWVFWKYRIGNVHDVGISRDGAYIAAVTEYPGKVFLLNGSGNLLWNKSLPATLSIEDVSISDEGNYVIVGSSYREVFLFDRGGNLLWQKALTPDSLSDLDMSPDGNYIAAGGTDNVTYLYDNAGAQIWNYSVGSKVNSVSISSDGEYVAAGSKDNFVYLLNKDGNLLWKYNTSYSVDGVSLSPDGEFLAAVDSDGKVFFFDSSGNLLWDSGSLGTFDLGVVSVSERGEYVAAVDYKTVTLLNKTGAKVWDWEADYMVDSVDISYDGRYVVAGAQFVAENVYFIENLKPSTITCSRSAPQIVLGEYVTISGSVDPPQEGVEVKLNYTKPDNSVMTRTVISGIDGSFSDTITPDVAGMWYVISWWGGNADYMEAKSPSTKFLVSAVKDAAVRIGKSRTLSDDFEPPGTYVWPMINGGLAYNESISCPPQINYTTESVSARWSEYYGMPGHITSFNITYMLEAFAETPEGTYEAEVAYDIYTYYERIMGGRSYTFLFSYKSKLEVNVVAKYASSISLTTVPRSIRFGENLSISGAITSEGGIAVVDVDVPITYRKPDGSAFTRVSNTLSNGSFSDALVPDLLGSWRVNATWIGDEDHYEAVSPSISFDVFVDLAHKILWENKTYNVQTTSNSTLQNFAFNKPLTQISFDANGLSGTEGFCNVTVPKTLLRGDPWTITIDDAVITDFIETENVTHSSVYFTYTHTSTRHAVIQGTWVVPEFPSAMILAFFMVCSLFGTFLVKRKLYRSSKSF